MKPEPVPLAVPRMPPPDDWMVTTAGVTLSTASMTALDSSMRTSLTLFASGEVATWPVVWAGSRNRFVTATADRAPDRMPATTAMAMIGAAVMPRRGGGDWVTRAGRLD